jgi:hypothetical protein
MRCVKPMSRKQTDRISNGPIPQAAFSLCAAIQSILQEWMTDICQMRSDLMGASRQKAYP